MEESDMLQLANADEALARLDLLEHKLHAMNAELANLHRLSVLGVLAAGIAHEINNLLTPVLSYAQLALAKPEDEELRTKALQRTCAGIESVSQIVHAILGLSRGESDQAVANVAEVFDETLRCLARNPAKDAIQLENHIDSDAWVEINPVVLQQVLLNLMLNATKALKGRRGIIRVGTLPKRNGCTDIVVSDDGPGIPPEIMPTIFESPSDSPPSIRKRAGAAPRSAHILATRIRKPCDHHQTGSGLGLSICRQLIENASGTISCISEPNNGATFTITLPTAQQHARKAG